MAKELPYFKFITSEWLDGEITLEELETQGLFINICALYWSKEGRVYLTKLKKRYRNATQESFNSLIEEGFIQVNEDLVSISFLDEQLKERRAKSLTNSKNGKKGGRPRKAKENQTETEEKPNALNSLSEKKANKSQLEENRIEEKREEEKKKDLKAAYAEKVEEYEFLFSVFWDKYKKKVDREKCLKKWMKLNQKEIEQIFNHVEFYVKSTPDKQYRKNPLTYLNSKSYQNEIITAPTIANNQAKGVSTRFREAIEKSSFGGNPNVDTSQL